MPRHLFPTLGTAVHYQVHYILHLKNYRYELPTLSGTSLMHAGSWAHAGEASPPERLVDAIDKRAGVHEDQIRRHQEMLQLKSHLDAAMGHLYVLDGVLYTVVHSVCLHGRVLLLADHRLRHVGKAYDHAADQLFDGSRPALQNNMARAWEVLGVILAEEKTRKYAEEAGAASAWALRKLREKGVIQ